MCNTMFSPSFKGAERSLLCSVDIFVMEKMRTKAGFNVEMRNDDLL